MDLPDLNKIPAPPTSATESSSAPATATASDQPDPSRDQDNRLPFRSLTSVTQDTAMHQSSMATYMPTDAGVVQNFRVIGEDDTLRADAISVSSHPVESSSAALSTEQQATPSNGHLEHSRKRKRTSPPSTESNDDDTYCECEQTQCLEIWCVCFAYQTYCSGKCDCTRLCMNGPEFEDSVHVKRREMTEDLAAERERPRCTCKERACLADFCECFLASRSCWYKCKCERCENRYGKKDEFFDPSDW